MSEGRLVKVSLPSKLVSQMDAHITKSTVYPGRTEFVTDAVANLLADLQAEHEVETPTAQISRPEPAERALEPTESSGPSGADPSPDAAIPRGEALALATIEAPNPTTPTLAVDTESHVHAAEPTWGMHNRDWPTIWAASILAKLSTDGPVAYDLFKEKLVTYARSIRSVLDQEWDLSGFPSSGSKAARSEARFIEFFVGSEVGTGPLFSFGIATTKGISDVLLTDHGAELLSSLAGMTRERSQEIKPVWRRAFLNHLGQFAPADVGMLREVVSHIEAGDSTRLELISAVEAKHPDWPKGTCATNAAGYVARAREWGLLAKKQVNHQYVTNDEAIGDLPGVSLEDGEVQ